METNYEELIPANDFKPKTEIRKDVVIDICKAFLNKSCGNAFHPYGDGWTGASCYIRKNKLGDVSFEDWNYARQNNDCIQIYKCEVLEAVKILQKRGYFIYEYYRSFSPLLGYSCGKYPTIDNGITVDYIYIPDNF